MATVSLVQRTYVSIPGPASHIPKDRRNLKRVDLYLDTGARDSINRWILAQPEPQDLSSKLSQLEESGVNITIYTCTRARVIDMTKELHQRESMSATALTGEELRLAMMCKQFSDVDIRAAESRRKSRLAHQLCLRHSLTHFDLLNSPSFDDTCRLGAAFFHGMPNIDFDTAPQPRTDAPAVEGDSFASSPMKAATIIPGHNFMTPPPMRRHRGHFYLDNFEFNFTSSGKLPSATEQVVSSLGAIITHHTELLPIIQKKLGDPGEAAVQLPHIGSGRGHYQNEHPTKLRRAASSRLVAPDPVICHRPIYSKDLTAFNNQYGGEFEGARWSDVDWRHHLQLCNE
ncbi:hypothetical protein IQ06DRAFT_376582 [Phaeosphaeriaceae sp. SRC1lsM3a]|nr:hypothetical protein IQ06DRAFT_376582 [Stagonospora sp. SRC1lsM3a]